jgi:glucose/arabinose dehydrogenase/PKD repeat protein
MQFLGGNSLQPLLAAHRPRPRLLRLATILLMLAVGFSLAGAALRPGKGTAATLPTGFQESVVFAGLTQPTSVAFAGDGRVFVAEKSGLVKVFDSLTDTSPTVFADLRTSVYNYWDRGLTGMVLDPAFPVRPYVYVAYTYDGDPGGTAPKWGTADATTDTCPDPTTKGCVASGRLSRLTADGDRMSGPEKVLIADWCQQFPSHSMGDLAFGGAGALYVSGGDGANFMTVDNGQFGNPCGDPAGDGGSLRSQDLATPGDPVSASGTVIRVDPDTGAALPSNPLAGDADPGARRIVADGLRNPFRMTARPGTAELWVGDVGWEHWEEINRIADGGDRVIENFGWPCYEGPDVHAGFTSATACGQLDGNTQPRIAFDHSAHLVADDSCRFAGSSVTGLAFYNGGSYPAAYEGALFFADYSRSCIYAMFRGADGQPDRSTLHVLSAGTAGPVDLEIGPNGDLFYVDLAGTIRRIRYYSDNQPPIADISAGQTTGAAPFTPTLDGSGSSDPEGGALTHAWDLDDDGAYDDGDQARVTPTLDAGTYPVHLRVTDSRGAIATATVVVTSGNSLPEPVIDGPAAGEQWAVGDDLHFSGHATDPDEGELPASSLTWSLVMEHCTGSGPDGCHAHPVRTWEGVAADSFTAPDHEYPSHMELRLTATDAKGGQVTVVRELHPRTAELQVTTNPAGLPLVVDGRAQSGPTAHTVLAHSTHSLQAAASQTIGGRRYDFVGWSDGGAASHTVTADGGAALVATYRDRVASTLRIGVSAGKLQHGQAVTVAGRLVQAGGPIPGATLEFFARPAGSSAAWTRIGVVRSGADGLARLAHRPGHSAEYQVRWGGSATFSRSESPLARVAVSVRVSVRLSATRVRRGTAVSLMVTTASAQPGRSVSLQRLSGGRWQTVTSRKLAGHGDYRFRVAVTSRGTTSWRVLVTPGPELAQGGSPTVRLTTT